MLEVEISTIYKKGDRTRKVHHLIYAPDFDTVDRISARLARIGNIASDGRPILGLDSRDLLEIALEAGPHAYLVPAHIWTPWFAALGSQSGFDSIADCYGDLADHIFAVETGLSSDPPMNWRVSFLDRYRLTSNSDAHSPASSGARRRPSTATSTTSPSSTRCAPATAMSARSSSFPTRASITSTAIANAGCGSRPRRRSRIGGRCPVCGEPVTIGVEHPGRGAGRPQRGAGAAAATAGTVSNLVPLPEILSELAASGPASQAVERRATISDRQARRRALDPATVPVEDIARAGSSLLAEAITRLRAGQVIRDPGYDGEYGVIRLFEDSELKRLTAGALLFDAPATKRSKAAERAKPPASAAPAARRHDRQVRAAELRLVPTQAGGVAPPPRRARRPTSARRPRPSKGRC